MDHSFLDQRADRWRSIHFKPGDGDCEHKLRAYLEPKNDAVMHKLMHHLGNNFFICIAIYGPIQEPWQAF